MSIMKISYPAMTSDVEREISEALARQARQSIHPSDLLSKVQDLLLAVVTDEAHPFWAVCVHWAHYGTTRETGQRYHGLDTVGALLEPFADEAIASLTQERLDQEWSD